MTDNIWRPIPGVERYEVSDQGEVRHIERKKLLKLAQSSKGYLYFYYWPTGDFKVKRRRKFFVHRAVALAFLGPPPSMFHTVDHVQGNRTDNRAAYLAWRTHVEQRRNQGHIKRGLKAEDAWAEMTADDFAEEDV